MNYEHTDVVFAIENSIGLKYYLNELLESYIAPALTIFTNGLNEETDVFFTQSSAVQFCVVFFGSELALNGAATQMSSQGPTTSQVSIMNAIKNANYGYRNTCRQAFIMEAIETSIEVFKELSGPNYLAQDSTRRCLILLTQSAPIQNPWATTTPENIIAEIKKLGIKTSIISAHKLVELYRLFENTGGDQQNISSKNYASKPQHLVLLNGFQLQERAVSPSLAMQATSGIVNVPTPPAQMGISNVTSVPNSNQATMNRPIPSPSQPIHVGSPAPSQSQPTQITMVRPPVVLNQTPASPGMAPNQVSAGMRVNPGMSNQLIGNQNPAVSMNTRPRWPIGPISTQQSQQQMSQMQQSISQPVQMVQGNMQPLIPCGMVNQNLSLNQQPMNPTRTASPTIIWQGTLEWSEKTPQQTGGSNFLQRIPCKISSQPMNGKMDIKTDGWPSTLQMLLVQKSLLSSVGNTYFQNIHKVMFYPDPCPALESLTASLSQGYAGCVHLSSSNIDVKMIILLFSPEKRAYVGFIPLDQNAFVAKIKEVFQSQSRNMQTQQQTMKQNVGGMMQRVGGPQVVAGASGQQAGVSQSTGMQMMSNTSNINVPQPNMIMQQQQHQQQQQQQQQQQHQQQNQMNPVMSQGGMTGGNPIMNAQVSQIGSNQVNQMGTGPQGQGSQMNMGPLVSQGGPMGSQIGPNQTVMGNKLIRPTMNIAGQQQPTDQMQMRQPMHSTNIRQQMQMQQQRPAMQVNLGGQQPRMMQNQMRQMLQQQRLQQQQQQQQQQQMMLIQQQNSMRPQMGQSQQVMGQQVMGQQGMQQGLGQQGMGQQGMGQGMGPTMQDNTTDYMDLL